VGRKARAKVERDPKSQGADSPESDSPAELEPIADRWHDWILFLVAITTVALVGLWFSLHVNRVFDVPKALALKVGGCGALLAWLLIGVLGPGYPWRSVRLFLAPVAALIAAVGVSTLLSIDPWMSLLGVYERQFGFQGLLACAGLYVVAASTLRSRRGAVVGLSALSAVGGIIGAYSFLQAHGHDPYGFFKKPHDKVYATLGNATFAGNALALIFPISLLLGVVAVAVAVSRAHKADEGDDRPMAIGTVIASSAGVLLLMIVPGWVASQDGGLDVNAKASWFKMAVFLAVLLITSAAAVGSWGFEWARLESRANQRVADAIAAGGLAAMAIAQGIGVFETRTRGAWVGTAAAVAGGLILMPKLWDELPSMKRKARLACLAVLGTLLLGGTGFVLLKPDHVYSRTIFSIPYAFDPDKTVYGQGQGTRKYLWKESPRVLYEHEQTLGRQDKDRADLLAHAHESDVRGEHAGSAFRKLMVWPFGIGIETYRYAFMSHKSKKLEALDPMTNHDNPHNNYLYLLASCGILGVGAYLWLLGRLISVAWKRFLGDRQPLFEGLGTKEGLIQRVGETERGVRLETQRAPELAKLLAAQLPELEVSTEGARVVLVNARSTETTPAAVRSQLEALVCPRLIGRPERALAFGVVTSFMSYAVYSIAGFDSVACSVFLYFLLGCAAALFEPSGQEPPRPIMEQLRGQIAAWRGRPDPIAPRPVPLLVSALIAAPLALLLVWTIHLALEVDQAEKAFVAEDAKTMLDKIDGIKHAIELNPEESFYRQSLGTTYGDAARQFHEAAREAERQGDPSQAKLYNQKSAEYLRLAEESLYAGLSHAWAPENIFISLFQIYYGFGRHKEAAQALERALEHSPHLSPVRANLAVIKAQDLGDYPGALKDCLWVLDVTPDNATALRTCGQVYLHMGERAKAKDYLVRAQAKTPNDPLVKAMMKELEAPTPKTATGATGATGGG
jgi:tetratricopeptide (TPR) repeat protein